MEKKEISVIIPVYNSSLSLKSLIDELFIELKNNFKSYELILIDDKSLDDSWKIITKLCETHTWIKGIALRKNVGQHNAILAGLRYASGQIIITMDDDGQNDPKYVKDLYFDIK